MAENRALKSTRKPVKDQTEEKQFDERTLQVDRVARVVTSCDKPTLNFNICP